MFAHWFGDVAVHPGLQASPFPGVGPISGSGRCSRLGTSTFYIDVLNVTFNQETIGFELDGEGNQTEGRVIAANDSGDSRRR